MFTFCAQATPVFYGCFTTYKPNAESTPTQQSVEPDRDLVLLRSGTVVVSKSVFFLDNLHGELGSNTEKDEHGPLPTEWIDGNCEHKPVPVRVSAGRAPVLRGYLHEFTVGKEVESTGRRQRFDCGRHINPFLRPVRVAFGERIDQLHEKQTCVDTDVVVANCSDGMLIGRVYAADGGVVWRETLQPPGWRKVWSVKRIFWQEGQ